MHVDVRMCIVRRRGRKDEEWEGEKEAEEGREQGGMEEGERRKWRKREE